MIKPSSAWFLLGFAVSCSSPKPTPTAVDTSSSTPDRGMNPREDQAVFVVHLEPGALPRDPETGLPHTARAEAYFETLLAR